MIATTLNLITFVLTMKSLPDYPRAIQALLLVPPLDAGLEPLAVAAAAAAAAA